MKEMLAKTLICEQGYTLERASALLGIKSSVIRLIAEEQNWADKLDSVSLPLKMAEGESEELLQTLEGQELRQQKVLNPLIFDTKIALMVKLQVRIEAMNEETSINELSLAAKTLKTLEAEFITKNIGKSDENSDSGLTVNIMNVAG